MSARGAYIVNAFTRDGRGGNPAGVVLDADDLDDAARLAIAAGVGVSETAFVSASATETVRLDFFTPTRQIAHCGHATIATFALLRQLGRISDGALSKQTIDGPRAVHVDGDLVFMEQRAPRIERIAGDDGLVRQVAVSVGLDRLRQLAIVDTGNRFALLELDDTATLASLRPDMTAIAGISESLDLVGYYAFVRTPGRGHVATTRMFAPRYGIAEEAATGMAAGPLAGLLHDDHGLGPVMHIEQGAWMDPPSPSALEARLEMEGGGIARLFVGGRARTMSVPTVA